MAIRTQVELIAGQRKRPSLSGGGTGERLLVRAKVQAVGAGGQYDIGLDLRGHRIAGEMVVKTWVPGWSQAHTIMTGPYTGLRPTFAEDSVLIIEVPIRYRGVTGAGTVAEPITLLVRSVNAARRFTALDLPNVGEPEPEEVTPAEVERPGAEGIEEVPDAEP